MKRSPLLIRQLTTKLSNGFTVVSEPRKDTLTATVGVWIDAGSRADLTKSSGTAHFLEHLSFKGTPTRNQTQLELEVEQIGAHLNAYTSRENTVFYARSLATKVPQVVSILSDILQKSKLEKKAIENERSVIIRESEEVDKINEEVVFDLLHSCAFSNQSLGRTILGPIANINKISQQDLKEYIKKNYRADRMVLVGAGAIDHEELVKLATKHFGNLPTSTPQTELGDLRDEVNHFTPNFIKQEQDLPSTYLALAVEGVSWKSPQYFTALVAQALVGSWDRASSAANASCSKLAQQVAQNGLASAFMSFSTSYNETGLWGVYLVSDDEYKMMQLIESTKRQLQSLGDVTEAEVESAKAQLKASLVLALDDTTATAEDIGRQMVTTGTRLSPEEIEREINTVSLENIQQFARKHLNGNYAIAAYGKVKNLEINK